MYFSVTNYHRINLTAYFVITFWKKFVSKIFSHNFLPKSKKGNQFLQKIQTFLLQKVQKVLKTSSKTSFVTVKLTIIFFVRKICDDKFLDFLCA